MGLDLASQLPLGNPFLVVFVGEPGLDQPADQGGGGGQSELAEAPGNPGG